jgi:3-hydroxyisobutyrate dehydrogenase-like beta-hydroxyacid dehydrogenase
MQQIGFIGLGVMGEPMCRNLAKKTGLKVVAFDRDAQPLERLAVDGVKTAANTRETVIGSDIIFLSLPSGEIVHQICQGPEGILACIQPGQIACD